MTMLAIGSAEIPDAQPADPVVVVVPLDHVMPHDEYEVSIVLPTGLGIDAVIDLLETTQITLTLTAPDGMAGAGTLIVICTADEDTGWVDASGFLNAGWTGTARLRSVSTGNDRALIYFQFDLTATAAIDGTPKSDTVPVLTDLGPDFATTGTSAMACFADTTRQPMLMTVFDDDLTVQNTEGVTGNWVDGASFLYGLVSWMAGT